MAGLFDAIWGDPSGQAMTALGAGLLGVRRGNEGRAIYGAMEAYNQAQQEQRRNELVQQQQQRLLAERSPFGALNPSDYTPESLAKFQVSKNYGELVRNPVLPPLPAAVAEWQEFQRMPPEDQERYLTMKRSPQYQVIGGVPHQGIGSSVRPLSTLPTEVDAKAQLAGGAERGKTIAGAQAQAEVDLPAAEAALPKLKADVQALLQHPGRKWGAGGVVGLAPGIPGTAQGDFVRQHKQLRDKAFLKAFETLKGGGQITVIEGEKATDAMNRMDRSTTDAEYEAAANDFIASYEAGLNKLRAVQRMRPGGYMSPTEQARGVRDHGMTEPVNRVPGADPLGIRR